jgi:peptidoglycan hydrolase-like protein with peptidoglycan-binding domain
MTTMRSRFAAVAGTAAIGLSVGLATLAPAAQAAPGIANISQGSSNHTGVKCVQQGINDWQARTGHKRPLVVDGAFGHQTFIWVENFQSASGLGVDGIVGQNTGNSILDNLQGDSTWRADCYNWIPSTHR